MRVYLIRHGRTAANEQWLYCGHTDIGLSEGGRKELEEKRSGAYPSLSGLAVYTSGLLRTEETLEILWGGCPHICEPRFAEVNFGDFEMRSYGELKDIPAYIDWCRGDNEANVPPGDGSESGNMMRERVLEAFDEVLSKGEDCLIVSHGGPICAIFMKCFPHTTLNRYEIQPRNSEGYLLEFNDTGEAVSCTRIP